MKIDIDKTIFPQLHDLRPTGVEAAMDFARQWAAAAAGLPGDPHAVQAVCRKQGWGTMQFNRSIINQPIILGGKTFTHGFGTHADSEIVLRTNQPIRRFRAWAGMDGSPVCRMINAKYADRLHCAVEVNGRELWRSPLLGATSAAARVDLDPGGVCELTLKAWMIDGNLDYAHVDWADVGLELADGTVVRPTDSAFAAQPRPTAETPPFSFTFGGRPSAELLSGWRVTRSTKPGADGVSVQQVVWHDPQSGLECELELQTFDGFPAVEWLLRFRNTGATDTPLLENIQPLDIPWAVTGAAQLRRSRGSQSSMADFEYLVTPLADGETIQMDAGGGRSSNNWLPFFNLQTGNSGVITAIGWTGQWAAEFARENGVMTRIRAGQELTHLVLHPGEEIRTPRFLLLFWNGEPQTSHNTLRRFILAHHTPRPDGEILRGPLTAGHWGSMLTSDHLARIEAYRQQRIDNEYYWIDAGWYGPPESFSPEESTGEWARHVGDWRINPVAYPQGFRPISDAAVAAGTKLLLWFEPERAVVGTPLPTEHPEWFLGARKPGASLLLDLGNPLARRWLIDFISDFLKTQGVHLYRQDFNFDPLPYWRAADAPDRQGMAEIRHVEGLYEFWDELLRRQPGLIIDNCASGGRRLDLETCSRSIPLWRSDWQCNGGFDPVGSQVEGMGLNYWLPLSACGTGVRPGDTYNFRSALAAAICFHVTPAEGYPYDWHRRMLAEFRRCRPLFYGDYYPLTPCRTEQDVWAAYQMHRTDIGEGFVLALRRPAAPFVVADFRLQALDPDAEYELEDADTGRTWRQTGQELRERGVRLTLESASESRLVFYRRSVDKE